MRVVVLFLCAVCAFGISHAACREELYEMAKKAYDEGGSTLPTIAALAYKHIENKTYVLLGTRERILQELYVHDATPNGVVFLDPRGWVFVTKNNGDVYALHRDGRRVIYNGFSGPPLGFGEDGDNTVTMVGTTIYRFDRQQNPPWVQDHEYTSHTIHSIFRPSDKRVTYMVEFNYGNDTINFYPLRNVPSSGAISFDSTLPFFFDAFNSVYYAGSSTKICKSYNTCIPADSGFAFQSFAVLTTTDVFAGGKDSTALELKIMKIDFSQSNMQEYYNFSSSSDGVICLAPFDSFTLVVGIQTSDRNGLYIFNVADTSLQQLSTLPIYGISTLRK